MPWIAASSFLLTSDPRLASLAAVTTKGLAYFFSSACPCVSGARVGDPLAAPPAGVWL